MKRFEKILLIIFTVVFLLQLVDLPLNSRLLFICSTWILALFYLIGSYWLFKPKEHKLVAIRILTGIAFFTSFIFLPNTIWLQLNIACYITPILNGLLFCFLGIYLILKRKSETDLSIIKKIFIRSFIILAVISFLTYTPITFKPYRKIIYALNSTNTQLQNNILMFDYTDECEDALANGDCDKAIEFGLKANSAGKIWLGLGDPIILKSNDGYHTVDKYPSNEGFSISKNPNLDKISGTFSNLYKAYRCKANGEYSNQQIKEALNDYQLAHTYLTACNHHYKYWEEEVSWSLNNIANCYKDLKMYSVADSLFIKAIENYKTVNKTVDKKLAKLFSNFALSLSEEGVMSYSNSMYQTAISILSMDTLNVENRSDLAYNYNKLTLNHIQQDSLNKAIFYIQKALKFSDKNNDSYSLTTLCYGICCIKTNDYQKADSILKISLHSYNNQSQKDEQRFAECYFALSQANIALAKYDDAEKYIDIAIRIITKKFGPNSVKYANYLNVLASINKIVGNYDLAEKQYTAILEIYSRELGKRNDKMPPILVALANLEVTLSKMNLAKQHSDSSMAIASSYFSLSTPNTTDFLNEVAFIHYNLDLEKSAENLYHKVIKINNEYGFDSNVKIAVALNGLGLIEMAKKNYIKSESLFTQSLKLHQHIFSDNHPSIAIIYLNLGNLYLQTNKLALAEEKINKAFLIDKQFFKSDHDIFADIFVAQGDLAKKKKQNNEARSYYQKALTIYLKKFDEKHWKIIKTNQRIKQCD